MDIATNCDTIHLCDQDETAKQHEQVYETVKLQDKTPASASGHNDGGEHGSCSDDCDDDYDDVDDEELEEGGSDGFNERTWGSMWHSRHCAICVYLFLAVVLLASVVALVVTGALVVAPYQKAARFKSSTCQPTNFEVDTNGRQCSCGKGCNSRYPCVRIWVSYTDSGGRSHTATMFENEAALQRECTYYPTCKSSRSVNDQAIMKYIQSYGSPHSNYSCLYNPKRHGEVIRTRRFQTFHVAHGMFWPSIVLAAAAGVLCYFIRTKGCDFT